MFLSKEPSYYSANLDKKYYSLFKKRLKIVYLLSHCGNEGQYLRCKAFYEIYKAILRFTRLVHITNLTSSIEFIQKIPLQIFACLQNLKSFKYNFHCNC